MVEYVTGVQEPKLDPDGVKVEYDSHGRPLSAVAEVMIHEDGKSTKILIEYRIEDSIARLQSFRKPAPVNQEHFRGLPIATRQIECLGCVDRVERPEKTIGDAIMEGHNITNHEERDQHE